jgi:hypothetical protein
MRPMPEYHFDPDRVTREYGGMLIGKRRQLAADEAQVEALKAERDALAAKVQSDAAFIVAQDDLERRHVEELTAAEAKVRELEAKAASEHLRFAAAEAEVDTLRAEVEHWVTRYNELEAWRVSTAQLLAKSDAEVLRLRAALHAATAETWRAAGGEAIRMREQSDWDDLNTQFVAGYDSACDEMVTHCEAQARAAEEGK